MIIETQRLVLRPLKIEDAADIQKHFPHWDTVKSLSRHQVKWPYPADGAYKYLTKIVEPAVAAGDNWLWGITRKENPNEVIGVVHLRRHSESGNRFMWLAKEHQSKGYMSEALAAVNDYAFDALGFAELVVKNAHDNTSSSKIKSSTGAERIDVRPADHYIGGCPLQDVWRITKESWQAHKAKTNAATAQKATQTTAQKFTTVAEKTAAKEKSVMVPFAAVFSGKRKGTFQQRLRRWGLG